MIRKPYLLLILILGLVLALGAAVSCTTGDDDDDDDDNDDDNDDDTGDDDDDNDTGDDDDDDDTGDDDDDDDTGDDDDDDDDTSGPFAEDFEAYSVFGDMAGGGWDLADVGDAIWDIVALKAGSGNILTVTDDTTETGGSIVHDVDPAVLGAASFTLKFDAYWEDGVGQSVQVLQNDTGTPLPDIEVDLYIDHIETLDPVLGWLNCGAVNFDQWYTYSVVVDTAAQTYDLSIDGAPSATCTDVAFTTGGSFPLQWIAIVEYNNIDGGSIWYDNIEVFETPAD